MTPAASWSPRARIDNDESLFTAMRAGARGYLVKGAADEQIVRAIHVVAAGEVVFGGGVAAHGHNNTALARRLQLSDTTVRK